jgi:hypothetical protein
VQVPHIFDFLFSFRITLLPRAQKFHRRIVKLLSFSLPFTLLCRCVLYYVFCHFVTSHFLVHPCVQIVSLHSLTDPLFSIIFKFQSRPITLTHRNRIVLPLTIQSLMRTLRHPYTPYLYYRRQTSHRCSNHSDGGPHVRRSLHTLRAPPAESDVKKGYAYYQNTKP